VAGLRLIAAHVLLHSAVCTPAAPCRHVLTVYAAGSPRMKASHMTLGTPGLHSVRRVLLHAMVNPMDQNPCRPMELFVAHRWERCCALKSVFMVVSWQLLARNPWD
jgi:hypothetical protein